MLIRMIREIEVFSNWLGCVLVISFHVISFYENTFAT